MTTHFKLSYCALPLSNQTIPGPAINQLGEQRVIDSEELSRMIKYQRLRINNSSPHSSPQSMKTL